MTPGATAATSPPAGLVTGVAAGVARAAALLALFGGAAVAFHETLDAAAIARWGESIHVATRDSFRLALRWTILAGTAAIAAVGPLLLVDRAFDARRRRALSVVPFEREWHDRWLRELTRRALAVARPRFFLVPALLAPVVLLAQAAFAFTAPTANAATGHVWDTMPLVVVVVGAVAFLGPILGAAARARLFDHPLFEESLLTLQTPRARLAALRSALAPYRRLVLMTVPLWFVAALSNWFLRWTTLHSDHWLDRPQDLLLLAACVVVWCANYVAGCHLRATIMVAIRWWRKAVSVAILLLLGAAMTTVVMRSMIYFQFRTGPPDWIVLPDWRGLTPSQYVVRITVWCTLFEAFLALGRTWLAIVLWRRFGQRFDDDARLEVQPGEFAAKPIAAPPPPQRRAAPPAGADAGR